MRTLKSWGSRFGKTTGIFNPKIAAITALSLGMATQGWGSVLSTSLGLSGAASTAFTAGISSVATQGGLSLMRNNLDPLQTVRDVTQKDVLLNTLESMAVGGALSGVIPAQHLSGHFTKAAVKSAIHAGFQTVQGHSLNVQDIFKDVLVTSVSGAAASQIGDLYGAGDVDPFSHKVLHGVVGGLSGAVLGDAKSGALSGASAAIIAETLMEMVRPTMMEMATTLAGHTPSKDVFEAHFNDYLTHQTNLVKLTTAAVVAGFGGDIDVAIQAADNALSNNAAQMAMAAATIAWEIYAVTHEAEVELAKDAVIDFVADKTGFSKDTVSKTFDTVAFAATTGNVLKGGVKAASKVALKKGVQAVKPYEVGTFQDLKNRSVPGDKMDIHHAPQKHPAKQVIPGYNEQTAPSIAVPEHLHRKIPNDKGKFEGTPRQLLSKTAKDLRNHTDASNADILNLINKTKSDFPNVFKK